MFDAQNRRLSLSRRRSSTGGGRAHSPSLPGESLDALLGRQLHRLRRARGFSRKALAARLGVPITHIEGHERGTRRFAADELAAYARFFRVRISRFFRNV